MTAAAVAMPTTMSESRSAVMTPVSDRTAISTSAATAASAYSTRSRPGSGSSTSAPMPCRFLRNTTYCTSPSAMPMAARPKPQWKPALSRSRPVSSGPTSAPMLMPM